MLPSLDKIYMVQSDVVAIKKENCVSNVTRVMI